MTTSLAAQLAGLAAQRTARQDATSSLRVHASYLFPPRVAAEQDYATVHALGVTGWEQLVNDDAALGAFAHAQQLFGEESIGTDRATLDASENDRLDAACAELLYLLGPVLLSRSAAKCLEWLVRRFAVHEHVPVALLHAFLPYHATPQFARMLQLLPVDRVPLLRFLQAVKKAQAPLPTSVLLQAMASDADVLRLVAQTATPVPDKHRFPVTFWTATLVQFCLQYPSRARRKSSSEGHATLALLLPEVLRLLTPAHHEAAVGALMVLCSMSSAFPLRAEAVRGVLERVARLAAAPLAPALARALAACCFALCASPETVSNPFADVPLITDAALDPLLQLPELGAQVERALREHDVRAFVAQLLAALVARVERPEAHALLDTLLATALLPASLAQATCEALIARTHAWAPRIELLAAVRQRTPEVLDCALDAARARDERHAWAVFRAVLHRDATGTVSEAEAELPSEALWLGVHSQDASQRLLTLQELLAAVHRGALRAEDALVRDAAHAALAEPTVPLLETLYDSEVLLRALSPDALLDAMAARLANGVAPNEYKTHVRGAARLPEACAARVWQAVVWPYVLREKHMRAALAVLDADAPGVLGVYASAAQHAPRAPVAGVAHYVLAAVAAVRAEPRQLAFVLRCAQTPVSHSGALALLVLGQLLAGDALEAPHMYAVGHAIATLLVEHQLLAGDEAGVPSSHLDAVLGPVLETLSRRSVRLLGLQLLYILVERVPVVQNASLFVAVQQQSTDAAHLLWHTFATLHAPGAGPAAARLAPVLYRRLGHDVVALLAGLWSRAPEHDAAASLALRVLAVRQATQFVREAAVVRHALNLQTVLPSVLLLLQAPAPVLRDAGAQFVRALAAVHHAAGGAASEIYGYDAVYGAASGPLQYLDGATLVTYVARLAEHADAFVNDAASLASVHAAILAGKKEHVFRNRVLCYVLSHAVCWPSEPAACALLQAVELVHAPCKLQTVAPLVERAVAAPVAGDAVYLQRLFATYEAPALSDTTWQALRQALQRDGALQAAALQALQAQCAALPPERRAEAFLTLAETRADAHRAGAERAAQALRTLPVSDAVLVQVLRTLLATLGASSGDEARSKRVRADDAAVRRAAVTLIAVLESMQSRTLGVHAALVAALFDVVRAAIALHATVLFNAEYLLQLAMQSLCALFDHLTSLPREVAQTVRADTIVHAIKISGNMQSINHAILLLTRFARLDAELVLHNIMPIFTFVGHTVLQRDDRFTLSVVEQTLRSIVPAFVNAVRPQVVNAQDARLALWLETRALLRIFSDAASHIPRHRRPIFFRLLVDVLGASDFLAPVAMLLADRVAHRVGKAPANAAQLLALPLGVLRAEHEAVRLHALNQIWPEIQRLYAGEAAFLDQAPKRAYSEEHLAPAKQALTLLCLVRHALPAHGAEATQCAWHAVCTHPTDAPGRETLAEVRHAAVSTVLDAPYAELVRCLLHGARSVPGLQGSLPAALPVAEVQRTALALLDTRPVLDHRALHEALVHVWTEHRGAALGDAALDALHRSITRSEAHLGALLPPLLDAGKAPRVLALLAHLVTHLGVKALAYLAPLVGVACDAADTGTHAKHPDESAAMACAGLQLLTALFRALPQFLHAYVERVVRVLSSAPMHALLRARAPGVRSAHRALQDVVVKRMPFATLLEALEAVWGTYDPVHLLGVLHQAVRGLDKAAVHTHYKALFRLLLRAFALQPPDAPLAPAPERAVQVYVALALQLSESQFRPLFLRTYDWAAVDLLEEGNAPHTPDLDARLLVLYTLVCRLLNELGAMVTSYYAVVYPNALETLARLAPTTPLWLAVAESLTRCAEADEGSFWNATRATQLVTPLLAALPSLPSEEGTPRHRLARPFLSVASTVPDDAYLRALNAALMSHASSSTLRVRCHALELAADLWAAHGTHLLGFVPETVAQLSELLDDIDPRASAAALRLRRAIEAALGEPLDAYLE